MANGDARRPPHGPPLDQTLLEAYDAFAIDLDGVVWRADQIIPEAPAAIAAIQAAGKPLLLLTNNASYLPALIIARLAQGGITVSEDEILTSSDAAREWIKRTGLVGARAFVLGTQPVIEQIEDLLDIVPVERGTSVDLVFVARDLDLSYERLAAAAAAVRNGAVFAASNRDNVMPIVGGFDPGTGSVLAAVECAAGQPAVSMGKPELPMMQAAAERLGTSGVLMIGDRLDSDVAGARRIGWGAALVMTGVTRPGMPLVPAPDYVLDTLGELPTHRLNEALRPPGKHAETTGYAKHTGGQMIDQVRDTLRKATKVVDAPRQRAEEVVRKMAENPNFDLLDAPQLAVALLRRGKEQADRARTMVDGEIRRRLNDLGLATREEVDRLRLRIAELEATADADRPIPPRRVDPRDRSASHSAPNGEAGDPPRARPPAARRTPIPPASTTLPAIAGTDVPSTAASSTAASSTPTSSTPTSSTPGEPDGERPTISRRRASIAPRPAAPKPAPSSPAGTAGTSSPSRARATGSSRSPRARAPRPDPGTPAVGHETGPGGAAAGEE